VGVSGHILELLGTWDLNTIRLGKSVSQERKVKGRKFEWEGTKILRQEFCVHEGKGEQEREIEAGATMEGEF
jgi:hypothetical protein